MQISEQSIKNRLKNFRKKLFEKGLDAALVTKRENYLYLSGFTGTFANLIITEKDAILVTDFRYVEQARVQAGNYVIIQYQGNLNDTLNSVIKEKGIRILGFENASVTHQKYSEYSEKLDVEKIQALDSAIEELRIIKDNEELDIIRKAVRIADEAFTHILKYIKPGVAEIEIAAELEYFMKKNGAKGPSFETIVASGHRAAMPHGVASDKKLELGDSITLDYGAINDDYCSDMTRTVFLGKPPEEMKRVYGIVLDAQQKALNGACKGLSGKDIDMIARNIIDENGYGSNFGHGLGHGVGLEIHEDPRLSPSGERTMENGMVVTVEPGIYVSGLGGVRIEDMIVIKDNAPMVLTTSAKEMLIL